MSVNKVILVGRLGADPESRSFPNGGSICNINIATSERWKNKETGERKERTTWHRVTLQNKLGEIAQQYLRKGSQVYIEGSIRHREYEQEGVKKHATDIIAREMTMLDSKGDGQQAQQAPTVANNAPVQQQKPPATSAGYLDQDIPF